MRHIISCQRHLISTIICIVLFFFSNTNEIVSLISIAVRQQKTGKCTTIFRTYSYSHCVRYRPIRNARDILHCLKTIVLKRIVVYVKKEMLIPRDEHHGRLVRTCVTVCLITCNQQIFSRVWLQVSDASLP